jgi:hypothetical protein
MRGDHPPRERGTHKPNGNKRQHGRLPQELLQCNLGEVINLSSGGIRVRAKEPPVAWVEITFEDFPLPGVLTAELLWTLKVGRRTYESGLAFKNKSDAVNRVLTEIASMFRFRRTM